MNRYVSAEVMDFSRRTTRSGLAQVRPYPRGLPRHPLFGPSRDRPRHRVLPADFRGRREFLMLEAPSLALRGGGRGGLPGREAGERVFLRYRTTPRNAAPSRIPRIRELTKGV